MTIVTVRADNPYSNTVVQVTPKCMCKCAKINTDLFWDIELCDFHDYLYQQGIFEGLKDVNVEVLNGS